jgi:hypothetical protein
MHLLGLPEKHGESITIWSHGETQNQNTLNTKASSLLQETKLYMYIQKEPKIWVKDLEGKAI